MDLPLNRKDSGSVALNTVVNYPTFSPTNASFDEIHNIVANDQPANKLRFDVYNSEDNTRMVRAYQCHSMGGIIKPDNSPLPLTQDFILHGTSLENAHSILRDGLRLLSDRKEHHFVDAMYSQRQFQHLQSKSKKEVWLIFSVILAEQGGCSFHKLRNEVIVSTGCDGYIPGTVANSCWGRKRQHLDAESIKLDPPRVVLIPPLQRGPTARRTQTTTQPLNF